MKRKPATVYTECVPAQVLFFKIIFYAPYFSYTFFCSSFLVNFTNSEFVAVLYVSVTSRRGSNASLTLDLQASPEMGRWDGTPPKER